MIQFIHIIMSSRPSICVSADISGLQRTRVQIITGIIGTRVAILLDLLDFTAQAGFLDVLINFSSFYRFFRLHILFRGISPTSHIPSHSILGFPVGTYARTVLGNMQQIFLIRNSYLLAKHAIALGTVVLVHLL